MSKNIEKQFKQNAKVALASNLKYRGVVSQVVQPYTVGDPIIYNVMWKGYSAPYQYSGEMLISETEANEIKKRIDEEAAKVL